MYLSLVWAALCDLLYFALHVTCSGTFPKPLPPRQERECLERIRQGDLSAKNTLIEHNLRLVAHIVKKYYAVSGEQEDLISIGTIGLIKAASTFDVSLSEPVDTDREGNSLTLMDIMSEEVDMVGQIDLQLKSAQLRQYINSFLDGREREIIALRYGLGGGQPLTQREVAKRLGISRSYVSRIEKKAVEVLRCHFMAACPSEFSSIQK